jgi:hypothetical protein
LKRGGRSDSSLSIEAEAAELWARTVWKGLGQHAADRETKLGLAGDGWLWATKEATMRQRGAGSRRMLGAAALGAAGAGLLSAGALALTGYSVSLKVPSSVSKGETFTAKASGSAANTAHLFIYLDTKSCATKWSKESTRDGVYQPGHPYFKEKGLSGPVKSTVYYASVKGPFKRSPTAHAGTHLGRDYACAYLTSKGDGSYRVTAAHKSATLTVHH